MLIYKSSRILYLPWLFTSTIGAFCVEIFWRSQNRRTIAMSLALDRESVMNAVAFFQQPQKLIPKFPSFSSIHEMFRISNKNESFPCPGEQDVQALRRGQEANVPVRIATCKGDNHDVTLIPLEIVCAS